VGGEKKKNMIHVQNVVKHWLMVFVIDVDIERKGQRIHALIVEAV